MDGKDKMASPRYSSVFKVTETSIFGFFEQYRFLSNFHLVPVYYEGLLYPSTENAYQASKFNQNEREVFTSISPAESKRHGSNNAMKYTADGWEEKRLEIMTELLLIKFNDPIMKRRLLLTDAMYLEETNYWGDVYWGVYYGDGENNLGKILMKIRKFWSEVCSDVLMEPTGIFKL